MKTVLIVAVLMSGGCRQAEVKPAAIGWRPLGSWSGRGNAQTESFNSESGHLRLKWETRNEEPPGAGWFKLMVHSAVSGRPLALAVEHRGVGRDQAYVSEDPRLFHLVVDSSHVDWSVSVEEAVASSD